MWEIFKENNVKFIAINQNIDTSTITGEALIQQLMVFAELESKMNRQRAVQKREFEITKKGKWYGGTNPDEKERLVRLLVRELTYYDDKIKISLWNLPETDLSLEAVVSKWQFAERQVMLPITDRIETKIDVDLYYKRKTGDKGKIIFSYS
ncbi:hypothetical protein ES703_107551 [subsurface metagenome]